MSTPLRMGIIGYGGMANYHHRSIKDRTDIVPVGVYDIAEKANAKAIENGLKVHASAAELLSSGIDIVLIATPNDVHKDYAVQALEAGINVISEKPVAMDSGELQTMIDTANKTGKLFTVHQNRRWDKDYLVAKAIIEQNLIGNVFAIESRVMGANGIPGDWRAMKKHGGGMVLDWGVHLLDQICDVYKEKIVQIYSRVQHITTEEVDDGFKAILTFESGRVALVEVSTNTFVNLPRWHISGLYGTAVINDWDATGKMVKEVRKQGHDELVAIKAGAGLTKTMAPRDETSIEEIPMPVIPEEMNWGQYYSNVIAHLAGKEPIIVTHEQVMRVMKVMETIFESEAKGAAINCNL